MFELPLWNRQPLKEIVFRLEPPTKNSYLCSWRASLTIWQGIFLSQCLEFKACFSHYYHVLSTYDLILVAHHGQSKFAAGARMQSHWFCSRVRAHSSRQLTLLSSKSIWKSAMFDPETPRERTCSTTIPRSFPAFRGCPSVNRGKKGKKQKTCCAQNTMLTILIVKRGEKKKNKNVPRQVFPGCSSVPTFLRFFPARSSLAIRFRLQRLQISLVKGDKSVSVFRKLQRDLSLEKQLFLKTLPACTAGGSFPPSMSQLCCGVQW